ncbi:MAG: hypothetical protein HOK14_01115 [Gammaproteobacteria bacterium]|jgi:hypothetical protein|nr:hypothetical protein [Gammaproteobacteria bacterium]MBT7435071.1 hypothetical protein [Gammaproteobacteria bacterium]
MTSNTTLVIPYAHTAFAFTDRPYRKHTYLNAKQYVALWDAGQPFNVTPPTAVMTWADGNDVCEAKVILSGANLVDSAAVQIVFQLLHEGGDELPSDLVDVSLFVNVICYHIKRRYTCKYNVFFSQNKPPEFQVFPTLYNFIRKLGEKTSVILQYFLVR